jgi:glycosyltransferase involved in cell wall biosynthesis
VVVSGSWSGPQRRPAEPSVSVVIPALNEARNLPHVLSNLPDGLHQVILVDGHSVDDTVAVARACRPDIEVVSQTRRGKGNALACGFAVVTGDIIVMLDADGSADPREIDRFVAALVDGADYAKGTRFADGGDSEDITTFRAWGNRGLNGLVNALFGASYTDLCYGYNAFWTRLLPVLDLPPVNAPSYAKQDMMWGDGFEIETLINIRVVEAGVRISEVGSVELARLNGRSNLNAVSDGIRVLRTALQERRYRRMRATARSAARAAVEDAMAQLVDRYGFVEPEHQAVDKPGVRHVIDLRAALANRSDNTGA